MSAPEKRPPADANTSDKGSKVTVLLEKVNSLDAHKEDTDLKG